MTLMGRCNTPSRYMQFVSFYFFVAIAFRFDSSAEFQGEKLLLEGCFFGPASFSAFFGCETCSPNDDR